MRNISGKSYRKNEEPHFILTNFFENRAFYEIMSKNIVEPDRPQMTMWRMRIACWLPKATNTHSEYVILIAFPLQQWLHERASILRCMYIAYHAYSTFYAVSTLIRQSQWKWKSIIWGFHSSLAKDSGILRSDALSELFDREGSRIIRSVWNYLPNETG